MKLPTKLRSEVFGHVFYEQRHALRARIGASYASSSGSQYSRGDPNTAVIKILKDGTFRVVDVSGMLFVSKQLMEEYRQTMTLAIWNTDTEFFSMIRNFNFDRVSIFLSTLTPEQIEHINDGRGKHANFTLVLGFTQRWEVSKAVREWNPGHKSPEEWREEQGEQRLDRWHDFRKAERNKRPQKVLSALEGLPAGINQDEDLIEDRKHWAETRHWIDPGESHEKFDFHAYHNTRLAPWDGFVEVDYAIDLDLAPSFDDVEHLVGDCEDEDIQEVFRQWNARPDPEEL